MKDLPPAFRSIPNGVELVEALTRAFSKHRGWVQAVGFVENAELKLGSEAADVRRTFRGRFALAHFAGPLGGPYGATLARADGERVEVLAGVLLSARSEGVSALCVSAGIEPPSAAAPAGARAETSAEVRDARPMAPPRAAPSSFAARVGVSAPEDDDEPQSMPERGDLVEHFAFGLCEVLNVTGDRIVLRDLRGPGRIREIASDRLEVTGPTEHDGKRLYRLTRKA
ncbi:MAG TPA: hypothetical protein VF103_08610 [Polyangiaceae bacterium]